MGFHKEEEHATPPPWGWPPQGKENAHGVEEIVYHKATKQNMHTKGRRHEQEKVYHKTRRRSTPHGPPARDPRGRLERICEPVRADIAAALRESPQHPVRNLAEGVQARRGLPDHPARQPLDIPGVRHREGAGVDQRGQGQHGRPDEAHRGDGHPVPARRAGAQALAVRREDDGRRGLPGQGRAVPQDVLQPHRVRRHGRLPRPDAIPPWQATKAAATGPRGADGPRQAPARGQAAGRERGEGARALRDGHRRLEERDQGRAAGHAGPLLEALRHRAPQPHQPGRGRQGDQADEGPQGPADRQERDDGQRLRVPQPGKARQGLQGRDLLYAGLRLVRERRHRELQPPRQKVVSEGNGLQRESLNGETAYAYDSRLAKAA